MPTLKLFSSTVTKLLPIVRFHFEVQLFEVIAVWAGWSPVARSSITLIR